jgi:hypothetical protein
MHLDDVILAQMQANQDFNDHYKAINTTGHRITIGEFRYPLPGAPPTPPPADGPCPPDEFSLGGETARELTALQYRLLAVLWPVGKRVSRAEVLRAVYGAKLPESRGKALDRLRARTQKALDAAKVQLFIEYKSGHFSARTAGT